jgi:2'-hydroxyisoflavone reductase
VRPGLIVGPWDATDRFGYWVARYVVPKLLGARGEAIVAPAPPERALQVVDARDLCAFMLDLVERRTAGVFNAVSPAGQRTFGDLVVALTAAARRRGRRVRTVWVDDAALVAAGVVPWTGLPLWIPASETAEAGFMAIDARRAAAAGLATRPLAATIDATAAWLATRPNAEAWRNVLAANAERALAAAGR